MPTGKEEGRGDESQAVLVGTRKECILDPYPFVHPVNLQHVLSHDKDQVVC